MSVATFEDIRTQAETRLEKNMKVKSMIIDRLGLDVEPAVVSDNQPLFGRGLEMDSLDTLEIVVMVNNEYDVLISDDDFEAFGSINALVDFIEAREV
ncbi:phosphopantetheine-binding protein [Streptomyces sp. NBC_00080]|uniref:acyl carrier protein n=2 Tax=Streptomyces TaxID=1883 RepID=UPI0011513F38|nr:MULTISPECIES: phosphopantetheine-binding protein [unclassified Streptomyces]MCX5368221.1 phosphopantetheine-binding protein [Streptomyces sp. NBC_00103]MDR6979355.1 acyl carrier protein [Streptomyces sp. 3330]TQJ55458.1 acyl carrier protein [Streptomyces sp. SLBN-115]